MMPSTTSLRRPKWHHHHHPPPPPTPKILHFPRRPRHRSSFKAPSSRPHRTSSTHHHDKATTLETLFDREQQQQQQQQQRACAPIPPPLPLSSSSQENNVVPIVVFNGSRERVERNASSSSSSVVVDEEDKWKFQAEMLRAECNLLRMEKHIALKKLDRTRSKLDATLRSALHTLLSGRIKICEGKNIEMVLDEEIHELTEKLQRLNKRSGVKDSEGNSRKNKNFDKQVSVLQRRLEKIGGSSDEIYLREFQEMANVSLSIKTSSRIHHDSLLARGKINVEILRRKMEGLSKGILLQRMEEEYNSLLSTASSSLASSASKRIEIQDSSSSIREKLCGEGNLCSGHCKTIVRRIVEQVRAETEQWSQMQEMLGQVREEMEELQASRDFWEDRAQHSHFQIQSLHNSVQEWKERAISSERKTNELEAKINLLSGDIERLRKEKKSVHAPAKCSQIPLETQNNNELEKRVVVCCSKENTHIMEKNTHVIENSKHKEVLSGNGNGERRAQATIGGVLANKRSPFRDIGNSPALLIRQNNGKSVFPLHSHLSSNAEKIF